MHLFRLGSWFLVTKECNNFNYKISFSSLLLIFQPLFTHALFVLEFCIWWEGIWSLASTRYSLVAMRKISCRRSITSSLSRLKRQSSQKQKLASNISTSSVTNYFWHAQAATICTSLWFIKSNSGFSVSSLSGKRTRKNLKFKRQFLRTRSSNCTPNLARILINQTIRSLKITLCTLSKTSSIWILKISWAQCTSSHRQTKSW